VGPTHLTSPNLHLRLPYAYTYTCGYAYSYTYTYTYSHSHTYTYTYTDTYTDTYTYTYSYSRPDSNPNASPQRHDWLERGRRDQQCRDQHRRLSAAYRNFKKKLYTNCRCWQRDPSHVV
jgi:hypothetical protein